MIRALIVQWRTLCMMYDDNVLEIFNISREIVSLHEIQNQISYNNIFYLCLSNKHAPTYRAWLRQISLSK